MKAWTISIALFSLASATLAAEPVKLSYQELQTIIEKNNKAVQSSRESVVAAKERVGTLERMYYPKAGFEAGIAEHKEANGTGATAPFWKVDVLANVYRGGRDRLAQSTREAQVGVREVDVQVLLRSELFKAKTDYLRLISVRQMKRLTQDSLRGYDSLKRSIASKVRAGLMTGTGQLSIEVETDELRRELILLDKEEHELVDRLLLVLGFSEDQTLVLTSDFKSLNAQAVPSPAEGGLEGIPEIRKLTLQSQSLKTEATARREWWLPEVSVFAAYTVYGVGRRSDPGSLPSREMAVGVRLALDLESKSTVNAEMGAKSAEISSLESQREYELREIEHRLHEYEREMATQIELTKSYNQGIAKSEALLKRLNVEFERGIGSSSDVTSTISSIYRMKRSRLEGELNYNFARAGVEMLSDR